MCHGRGAAPFRCAAEKAWGVRLAAERHCSSLAPEIQDELERLYPKPLATFNILSEGFWTEYSLLDALIQLRAPSNESALAAMVKVFPVEAVILMLQNPQQNPRLLAEARKESPSGMQWVALSNTLATARAPGFAATLLYEVEPVRSVLLSDDGRDWETGGVVGSIPGGVVQKMLPSDFPPVIRYRLTSKPAPDDELFSDGLTPIYLKRVTIAPGTIPPWPRERYCAWCVQVDCLAILSGLSAQEVARAVEGIGRITLVDYGKPKRGSVASVTQASEIHQPPRKVAHPPRRNQAVRNKRPTED